MKPRHTYKKKNPDAGCPAWVIEEIGKIREAAIKRPIVVPCSTAKTGSESR